MLARINRITVSAASLVEVMRLQAGPLPDGRSAPEAQMLRVFQLLMANGVSAGKIGELAFAVDFRLTALARLAEMARLKGWSRPGKMPGAISISPVMLAAAATEPLIEDGDGQPVFDEYAFRRRLLAAVKVDGSA